MMLLTQRGSSGSPLVRIENNQLKAIGIHKAKKKKKKKKLLMNLVK
jgi:V8-like Glu-specific endopeptidase